jgi:Domain of unknown function (DUF4190)/zinc-ribbon domain
MYCQHCGTQVKDGTQVCHHCGSPPLRTLQMPPSRIEDDPAMRMLLPVGCSVWAIAAGYAGLLALTVVLAPVAIILGICAIVDLRRHPEKHGLGRAIFGLVMGVLGLLLPMVLFLTL